MYSTTYLKTLINAITTDVGKEITAEYFRFFNIDAIISKADKLSSLGKFQYALEICKDIEQIPNDKMRIVYGCIYINSFKSGNLGSGL